MPALSPGGGRTSHGDPRRRGRRRARRVLPRLRRPSDVFGRKEASTRRQRHPEEMAAVPGAMAKSTSPHGSPAPFRPGWLRDGVERERLHPRRSSPPPRPPSAARSEARLPPQPVRLSPAPGERRSTARGPGHSRGAPRPQELQRGSSDHRQTPRERVRPGCRTDDVHARREAAVSKREPVRARRERPRVEHGHLPAQHVVDPHRARPTTRRA